MSAQCSGQFTLKSSFSDCVISLVECIKKFQKFYIKYFIDCWQNHTLLAVRRCKKTFDPLKYNDPTNHGMIPSVQVLPRGHYVTLWGCPYINNTETGGRNFTIPSHNIMMGGILLWGRDQKKIISPTFKRVNINTCKKGKKTKATVIVLCMFVCPAGVGTKKSVSEINDIYMPFCNAAADIAQVVIPISINFYTPQSFLDLV